MSDPTIGPPPAELEALIASTRALEGPTPDVQDRLWARLDASIGALESASGDGSGEAGTHPPAAIAQRAAAGLQGKLLLVTFALGAATGAGVMTIIRPPAPREPIAEPVHAMPTPASATPPAPAEPVPPSPRAPASTTANPPVPPPVRRPPLQSKVPAPVPEGTLDMERRLVESARAALVRGRGQDALDALERHAREFPDSAFVEEREVLWIQALVSTGQHDEARARAEAFKARFPRSLLTPAVDSALGTIP